MPSCALRRVVYRRPGPAEKAADRGGRYSVRDGRARPGGCGAQARPAVGTLQPQRGGAFPGRGQRHISIESMEKLAIRPDSLPPHRHHNRLAANHRFPEQHLYQPGYPLRRPWLVSQKSFGVSILRGGQQCAAAHKDREPGPGDIDADVHHDVEADEHQAS